MATETIVDIYCHIFPDAFFQEMNRIAPRLGNIGARLRSVKKLFDLDERFREMDQFGDYREVISLPNPPIEDLAAGEAALNLARIGNDAMAELCARHPARFPTFVAALSMTDVEGSVQEARRAVKELGAGGVQIFTNVAGRPLDEKDFEPIFATMAELDLPIWLHPARTASMPDYPKEQKSRFEMWWCFGWPYDTSVAMVRIALCGLLDRYPRLKIITHHLGGMIPYYDGRVGPGLDVLGSRTSDEDYSKILTSLKRPHLDYMRDFYGDTALFGGGIHAVRCGLEFFGAEHLVFATDTPLGPIAPTIEVIKRLEIADADRRKNLRRQRRAAAQAQVVVTHGCVGVARAVVSCRPTHLRDARNAIASAQSLVDRRNILSSSQSRGRRRRHACGLACPDPPRRTSPSMEAAMPRREANTPGAFEAALFSLGEPAFSGQRQECPSSLEFVIDDHSSAPLGAPTDAMHHYLFNSMPCAYAWFHH